MWIHCISIVHVIEAILFTNDKALLIVNACVLIKIIVIAIIIFFFFDFLNVVIVINRLIYHIHIDIHIQIHVLIITIVIVVVIRVIISEIVTIIVIINIRAVSRCIAFIENIIIVIIMQQIEKLFWFSKFVLVDRSLLAELASIKVIFEHILFEEETKCVPSISCSCVVIWICSCVVVIIIFSCWIYIVKVIKRAFSIWISVLCCFTSFFVS